MSTIDEINQEIENVAKRMGELNDEIQKLNNNSGINYKLDLLYQNVNLNLILFTELMNKDFDFWKRSLEQLRGKDDKLQIEKNELQVQRTILLRERERQSGKIYLFELFSKYQLPSIYSGVRYEDF